MIKWPMLLADFGDASPTQMDSTGSDNHAWMSHMHTLIVAYLLAYEMAGYSSNPIILNSYPLEDLTQPEHL